MKKKILNIVLAAAVTPFLCCCTDNFEEYNTNPYEPHSLNPPMLFATMITTGINVQQNDKSDDRSNGSRTFQWLSYDGQLMGWVQLQYL